MEEERTNNVVAAKQRRQPIPEAADAVNESSPHGDDNTTTKRLRRHVAAVDAEEESYATTAKRARRQGTEDDSNDGDGDDSVMATLIEQWKHQDEGALVEHALSFLDLQALLQIETVSTAWRGCCKRAIHAKLEPNGTGKPRPFETKKELKDAVDKYCMKDPKHMDAIAATYGYPIDKWNVSQITDMSGLFSEEHTFNAYIGSWDVSIVQTWVVCLRKHLPSTKTLDPGMCPV